MEYLDPIAIGAALILGWILKNKTPFSNQAIPIANALILFLSKLVLNISPAEAGVFGVLGHVGASVGSIAYQSVVQAVIASGAQSSAKATGRVASSLLKLALLDKLVGAASKEAAK